MMGSLLVIPRSWALLARGPAVQLWGWGDALSFKQTIKDTNTCLKPLPPGSTQRLSKLELRIVLEMPTTLLETQGRICRLCYWCKAPAR